MDPLPIPPKIEEHYGVSPENYWQPEYFEVPTDYFLGEFENLNEMVPDAKTFLDIGCGIGKTVVAALRNGYDAMGIEPSGPFFEKAKELLGDRVKRQSIEEADFNNEAFDIVSFGVVLEHLYNPSAAIEKALRWLKPKGVMHIEVPNSRYLFNTIFNLYFWLCRTDYVVNTSPMHIPYHLYEFTDESFQLNGEILGYSVARLQRYAGDSILAPRCGKFLTPIMNATGRGMGLIVYLKKSESYRLQTD